MATLATIIGFTVIGFVIVILVVAVFILLKLRSAKKIAMTERRKIDDEKDKSDKVLGGRGEEDRSEGDNSDGRIEKLQEGFQSIREGRESGEQRILQKSTSNSIKLHSRPTE